MYLKFITNKGCGGVGAFYPPNVGLSGVNPDLVWLQCGYRTPDGKPGDFPGVNPDLVGLQCGYRTPDGKPKKKRKKVFKIYW
ncbi:hypothetical protein H5410_009852 [Solanum commersonii]|uniref:Uncharacterized protein n=1 Tax=Solanum commersonii TaxID=4109 RepID=A0A9J6AKP3_SOLCO|nr:hypothetical protein H5410_009852 [Solanum commersonii]